MRVLRRGTEGADVRALQEVLNRLIPPQPKNLADPRLALVPDGRFGRLTEGRVRLFQTLFGQGLVVDGEVGNNTLQALLQPERVTVSLSMLRLGDGQPQPVSIGSRPRVTLGFGGPAVTRLHYDPQDALWVTQMNDWLTWLSLPPGSAGAPPPMPSIMPPSGSLLLRGELMKQFPWLKPSLPSSLPRLRLPNAPNVFPAIQDPITMGGVRRHYTIPETGWTTELQAEASGTFNPLKPKDPYKAEVEFNAYLFRLRFLNEKVAVNAGARITPLEMPWLRGVATVDVKLLKWEDKASGLSLAAILSGALTLPPVGLEGKGGIKAEWEWTKPLGLSQRGVQGSVGAWVGSKFSFQMDDRGGMAATGYPLLFGGFLSFSLSEPGHWERK